MVMVMVTVMVMVIVYSPPNTSTSISYFLKSSTEMNKILRRMLIVQWMIM